MHGRRWRQGDRENGLTLQNAPAWRTNAERRAPSAERRAAFPAGHATASVFVLQDRRVVHDAVDDRGGRRRVEEDYGTSARTADLPTPAGRRGGSALR